MIKWYVVLSCCNQAKWSKTDDSPCLGLLVPTTLRFKQKSRVKLRNNYAEGFSYQYLFVPTLKTGVQVLHCCLEAALSSREPLLSAGRFVVTVQICDAMHGMRFCSLEQSPVTNYRRITRVYDYEGFDFAERKKVACQIIAKYARDYFSEGFVEQAGSRLCHAREKTSQPVCASLAQSEGNLLGPHVCASLVRISFESCAQSDHRSAVTT